MGANSSYAQPVFARRRPDRFFIRRLSSISPDAAFRISRASACDRWVRREKWPTDLPLHGLMPLGAISRLHWQKSDIGWRLSTELPGTGTETASCFVWQEKDGAIVRCLHVHCNDYRDSDESGILARIGQWVRGMLR